MWYPLSTLATFSLEESTSHLLTPPPKSPSPGIFLPPASGISEHLDPTLSPEESTSHLLTRSLPPVPASLPHLLYH